MCHGCKCCMSYVDEDNCKFEIVFGLDDGQNIKDSIKKGESCKHSEFIGLCRKLGEIMRILAIARIIRSEDFFPYV